MVITDNRETRSTDKYIEQLQTVVHRYCLSLTKSRWDAEDLAQDTWLKGWGVVQGTSHNNLEALLLRIAKNTWIDQTRRKSHYTSILKQMRPNEMIIERSSLEIEDALNALMKHLSPLQRTVFLLRDVFAYSTTETAEMLGMTEGAAKAALHRARAALSGVQQELEAAALPASIEEDIAQFLSAFMLANEKGDMTLLVHLAQRDAADMAVMLGLAQTRWMQTRTQQQPIRPCQEYGPSMFMCSAA
ncbi:RNA polymerase sigma-70 factor (ECF subfamily) [Paenibacillus castaneae]|uniref:RNA polymerase sigma factor n=1 Tax=Paenibacillus castaneae TaxID=474957 RepID=UPI000C9C68FC|nr:RNA polymerase sigma factor [Paenibacillus castaneae]NIK76757.1 RNA polymerase sigma-70 factor (ECF subfamily) [Paenibacillus castaneae]